MWITVAEIHVANGQDRAFPTSLGTEIAFSSKHRGRFVCLALFETDEPSPMLVTRQEASPVIDETWFVREAQCG